MGILAATQHAARSVGSSTQVDPAHFVPDGARTLSMAHLIAVALRLSDPANTVEHSAGACERRRWGLEGERCGAGRREVITDDETTCCDRGCARGGTLGMSM